MLSTSLCDRWPSCWSVRPARHSLAQDACGSFFPLTALSRRLAIRAAAGAAGGGSGPESFDAGGLPGRLHDHEHVVRGLTITSSICCRSAFSSARIFSTSILFGPSDLIQYKRFLLRLAIPGHRVRSSLAQSPAIPSNSVGHAPDATPPQRYPHGLQDGGDDRRDHGEMLGWGPGGATAGMWSPGLTRAGDRRVTSSASFPAHLS